ncbi:PucR family transcriptional regulator [Baileyella intestinalis]|uniref:PucR family transcriptional regulator n=1 Tax=Baileyella intestinalis TaxID=2606709 RepID=UPI0022E48831|nr:helix-turn-helix domain-containing protein [Baileyella intestinalis]
MNFREIIEILGKKHEINTVCNRAGENIDRVRLWDGKGPSDDRSTLFFSYGIQYGKLPAQCIVAVKNVNEITETRKKASENTSCSLAAINMKDYVPVFNEAQDLIVSHYNSSFHSYLTEVAGRVGNYDSLVDIASQSFGASLIFIDMNFRILSYSTQVPVTDKIWSDNIKKGYCDYEFIQEVKKLRSLQESFSDETPVEVTCMSSPFRKIASRVYCRDTCIGILILIEGDHSYRQVHYEMMKTLSHVLAGFVMVHSPELLYQTDEYHQFLYNVFIGAPLESQPESYRNLKFKSPHRLVYLKPSEGTPLQTSEFEFEQCIKKRVECQVVSNRESAVVIMEETEAADFEKIIESYRKGPGLVAGISRPFYKNQELIEAIRDAKDAMEIGISVDPGKNIYPFEEYGMYVMIRNISRDENGMRYCHPAFVTLMEYDSEHEGSLLDTLEEFLRNGQSIKDTAENLYMHRNTVIYRLKKIEELTGVDLRDPETSFNLRFSFAIRKICGDRMEGQMEEHRENLHSKNK